MIIFATNMVTKFTRQEFSTACNTPNNTLTILAKRGKISINSARCERCEKKRKPCNNCKILEYIDLNYRNPSGFYINLDFFKKNTEGIAPVKQYKTPKPPVKKDRPAPAISVPVSINSENAKETEPDNDGFDDLSEHSSDDRLTRAKKFREIQNKEAATRLLELQEAKIRNEMIPLTMVEEIVQLMAESNKRAYADAGENLIMLIAERLQAQEHDKAFMRTKLLETMNKAIDNGVNAAQARIRETEEEDAGV